MKLKENKSVHWLKENGKVLPTAVTVVLFFVLLTIGQIVGGIAVGVPAGILAAISYASRGNAGSVPNALDMLDPSHLFSLSMAMTIFSTIIFVLYCRHVEKRSLRMIGFLRRGALKQYGLGLAVGFAMFAAIFMLNVITGSVIFEINIRNVNWTFFILSFLAFVIQGNSEEVLLRGFLMNSLASKKGVIFGVIVNSAVFAVIHLFNPGISVLAVVNLALFGLLMSLIYYKTDNIWVISGLHTIWNFAQGNIFGVLVSGMDFGDSMIKTTPVDGKSLFHGGDFGFEGGLSVTVILVVGIYLMMLQLKSDADRLALQDEDRIITYF